MQLECGDGADSIRERDINYATAESMVLALVNPPTDTTAATPLPTTIGEHMLTLDIVPRQSQMPQLTSRPGSCQMTLCSEQPQIQTDMASLLPDAVANSWTIQDANHLDHLNFEL
jgi:hypothetical protein